MAYLIFPNSEKHKIFPNNGKRFTLKELQTMIGGNIEIVKITHPAIRSTPTEYFILIVDEDGIMKGLQQNNNASILADQMIVGKVLLCKNTEID